MSGLNKLIRPTASVDLELCDSCVYALQVNKQGGFTYSRPVIGETALFHILSTSL